MDKIIEKITGDKNSQHLGDVVIVSIGGRHDAADLEANIAAFGLEKDINVYRVSAINAYKRAVRNTVRYNAVDERNWTVAKLKGDADEIIHQFVGKSIVDSDETQIADKAVRFSHEVATRFDVAAYRRQEKAGEDLISASSTSHPIAQRVMEEYRRLHLEVTGSDLTRATTQAFYAHHATRLRDSGGVWIVPATEADFTRRWAGWANLYGQALVLPIHDSQEARQVVAQSAKESIEGGLEELLEDLIRYRKETTRMSTLEARLGKLEEMEDKVAVYEKLLSISMVELREGIESARESFIETINSIEKK